MENLNSHSFFKKPTTCQKESQIEGKLPKNTKVQLSQNHHHSCYVLTLKDYLPVSLCIYPLSLLLVL